MRGRRSRPLCSALVHAINEALGAPGSTLTYIDPVEAEPVDQAKSLAELVRDMEAGNVDTLLILGSNPAFTAPADLRFGSARGGCRCRCIWGRMSMKRPLSAPGTCPRRMSSSGGAMRGPMTGR